MSNQLASEKSKLSENDIDDIIKQLKNSIGDNLTDEVEEGLKTGLVSGDNLGVAQGGVFSVLFWAYVSCYPEDSSHKFEGEAGGLGLFNNSAIGSIYGNNGNTIDSIAANAVTFMWVNGLVYFTIVWFGNESGTDVLGSFQSGALSISVGTGGGKKGWK